MLEEHIVLLIDCKGASENVDPFADGKIERVVECIQSNSCLLTMSVVPTIPSPNLRDLS